MSTTPLWDRFKQYRCTVPSVGLSLDFSCMSFADDYLARMEPRMQQAYMAMDQLEQGAIANPDENRMVGHYWLRAPQMAPSAQIRAEIQQSVRQVKEFASAVHQARIKPTGAARFTRVLSIGIGGSALGPMFVGDALGTVADAMAVHYLDNTDPDGIARVLDPLQGKLGETLVIVISKSGGTPETRNGMQVVQRAYASAGLPFAKHAVAITMPDSQLDRTAVADGWLKRFAMFDWVGGRTSQMSSVGLLPAALQGLDVDGLLAGAAACDQATRQHHTLRNPAAVLALMWYHATDGRGHKAMVVLPYKDRLLLLSRYLQQLVMESLGKRLDLNGRRVDQGLTVYGNKGSTDQHAYVQQLRDGLNNFFVTFVRVLESGGERIEVEPGVTVGDYLHGLLLGTRQALRDNERPSMTVTIQRVDAHSVGALIALFERAVGFYATLIHVNAYHQPGVEAGKKAAADALALQRSALDALSHQPQTAPQIARAVGRPDEVQTVFLLLEHLAANGRAQAAQTDDPERATFWTAP